MRRFSQRNPLVTLSDINITPLLDLAFVLLIIFVITTPLLEQGMDLKLPLGGAPDAGLERRDVRTVEIDQKGNYMLDRSYQPLDRIESDLTRTFRDNPKLIVYIRCDLRSQYQYFVRLVDRLQKQGITRYSIRTDIERN